MSKYRMENYDSVNSISNYSRHWKEKVEKRKQNLQKRGKMLKNLANKCSILLKKMYKVKKVYLIGSLVREYKIHETSDIDLVVVGLPDEDYFSALKELYLLLPNGVDIDLITEETATESMKIIIKKNGVLM